jgi:hypothetical protein
MPRAAYSKRFLCQAGLSGTGPSVIVPAGRVYVIRQATIYSAPLGVVASFLEDETTGAALFSARFNAEAGGFQGFFGALVFEPGQGFHFQVNATLTDACDVYCGGYDLSLDGT